MQRDRVRNDPINWSNQSSSVFIRFQYQFDHCTTAVSGKKQRGRRRDGRLEPSAVFLFLSADKKRLPDSCLGSVLVRLHAGYLVFIVTNE